MNLIRIRIKELLIIFAAIDGLIQEIPQLIANGDNINQNFNGKTALYFAISNNHTDIATLLIDNGIIIFNVKYIIDIAIDRSNIDILKIFLLKDIILTNPQLIRIIRLNNFSLIKILIEKGNSALFGNINILLLNINPETIVELTAYLRNPLLQNNLEMLPQELKSKLLLRGSSVVNEFISNDNTKHIIRQLINRLF